eukprot:TRINITY_DN2284_c0_g1_i2.p1 TRINITY_DN2284_c0_g1~~TRINITY_DN2284_c0_g1_i2.p1  ORF type:complete len:228 (+),score=30.74 TRINITY_DN2284_c0_g1_i2:62-745(+)
MSQGSTISNPDIPASNPGLGLKIDQSLKIIQQAIERYTFEGIVLAFNGGKDSVVLLHLIFVVLGKLPDVPKSYKLCTLYFLLKDRFPEVDKFLERVTQSYNISTITFKTSFKEGLNELSVVHPKIKAIFMGTRRTDPHSQNLDYFAPTDLGWPSFVRVNPLLDWSFHDIWDFILREKLPYCELYDRGYTSIGCTKDTKPNPALINEFGQYHPAYKLKDGNAEREGRT